MICRGGPCDGWEVSPALGDQWSAAMWVQYGSRRRPDGTYGHLLGEYVRDGMDYWWQGES